MTEVGLRGDLQKINRNKKIGAKLRPPYPQFLDVAGLPRRTTSDVASDALGDAFVHLTGVVLNADE